MDIFTCASSKLLSAVAIIFAIIDIAAVLVIAIYYERRRYIKEKSKNISGFVPLKKLDNFLKYAIMDHPKKKVNFILMLVGIDGFDQVNDFLSPQVIKEYLLKIKGALKIALPPGGKFATYKGDDTFLVYIAGIEADSDLLLQVGQNFKNALERKIKIKNDLQIQRDASVAIASFPESGSNKVQLLKSLLIGFYETKKAGGNKVKVCGMLEPPSGNYLKNYESIKADILSRKTHIGFMPIVNTAEDKNIGVEVSINGTIDGSNVSIIRYLSFLQEAGDELWVMLWALERGAIFLRDRLNCKGVTEYFANMHCSLDLFTHEDAPLLFATALAKYNIVPSDIVLSLDFDTISRVANVTSYASEFKNNGFRICLQGEAKGNSLIETISTSKADYIKLSVLQVRDKTIFDQVKSMMQNKKIGLIVSDVASEQDYTLATSLNAQALIGPYFEKKG